MAEFRGYRPARGSHQVVVTFEFADMNDWTRWYDQDVTQAVFTEIADPG